MKVPTIDAPVTVKVPAGTQDGKLFRMLGYGDVHFLDNKLDFDLRINAKGAPGFVLFPMSKLFQYKGEGSFTKPVWRPKRLPRQLFQQ